MTLNAFFSFYLLLNQFIPMELVINMEIAKMFVTIFFQTDATMTYPDYEAAAHVSEA